MTLLHERIEKNSKPRILIVEDEPFIALALEETLEELGFEIVASISHIADALAFLKREKVDIALLDVNIGLNKIDPVADALVALNCPFIFTTGYGRSGLPAAHAHRAVLEKPFRADDLVDTVRAELERPSQNLHAVKERAG
jgi:two-component SAPR family response regulator